MPDDVITNKDEWALDLVLPGRGRLKRAGWRPFVWGGS